MKSRRRNVPDYNPSVFRRKTRCMTLREQESFDMPTDLIIEILSRLPYKSIARFRCVSKLWASILRRPDFTELFLTRSSARPHLFFAYRKDGELFFFSTPQPRYLVEDSSPTLLASYQMKIPLDVLNGHFGVSSGWVFLRDWQTLKRKKHLVHVICNPSTGESLTLPSAKTERGRTFLGFDPIEKRYKVLSFYLIDNGRQYDAPCKEHQILTLGTRKPSWRTIKCMVHHHPSLMSGNVICIDGVLYYPASTPASYEISMIACFDVRTGKFRFIEYRRGTLVNYKGKLGAIQFEGSNFVSEATTSFKLYILEDVEKGEWSQHTYIRIVRFMQEHIWEKRFRFCWSDSDK